MYYSIQWERVGTLPNNTIQVRTTFLDEAGRIHVENKFYENWIGVCTNRIDQVAQVIRERFPGAKVLCKQVSNARKVLPYFEDRLARGKLDYRSKPFYKVYTSACAHDVGRLFNRYKFAYYEPDDWLTRVYIDICSKHDCHAFYYRWYEIDPDRKDLTFAYRMVPERNDQPDWTFAAFDLESVPLQGNHVPMGHHPGDRIVMVSLCKWNRRRLEKHLLYVLPERLDEPLPGYPDGFRSESDMLVRFHELLDDAHVITGYNINSFDFPCLFARLLRLRLKRVLLRYTSSRVGADLVVRYDGKMTIDLYAYFKTFSGYDLPSYKLDDVARVKLEGETKLPVKATGLWSWYRRSPPRELFAEEDAEVCFRVLQPETVSEPSDFGTFRQYLDYCLRDSELVYSLHQKEHVVPFLVERANFTNLDAAEALHLGNSRYLLELFKTYGTRLGYFLNPRFFRAEDGKVRAVLGSASTYQGALNFCLPERSYEDVAVMDFASMYPSTLVSSNLCYGTCALMTRDEWTALPPAVRSVLAAIPYQTHSGRDFECPATPETRFSYPAFDPEEHEFAIVTHPGETEAFLPKVVSHFVRMRRDHQKAWRETGNVYHYNVQLGIKILVNSLYGVMANRDSPLAYLPVAMIVVTLSRYQLLGSYRFLRGTGYEVCYADTDSLMVCGWPEENCDAVNAYLGLPSVELKFEQRMKRLLVLSKKRYVYEASGPGLVTKGFQKKINGLIEYMTAFVLDCVWRAVFDLGEDRYPDLSPFSRGCAFWADLLQEAQYRCRDPKKYAIYRKVKKLDEYVSQSCPAVKYLKKYPDRNDEHVEFTYGRADVAVREASNWVVDAQDCRQVNYEQLFVSQKKIFYTLFNMAFWRLSDPASLADRVLNALNWKRFVHAELLHRAETGCGFLLLVEPGVRYTFSINDHLTEGRGRRGRKRKVDLGMENKEEA